jgi:hypothetical protein
MNMHKITLTFAAVALLGGCVTQPPHVAYVATAETSCYVGEPDARTVSIAAARRMLTQCRSPEWKRRRAEIEAGSQVVSLRLPFVSQR